MRAVIYARVSTEEQAKHNFSLESQVDLSRKWVVDHKFELACEPFVDAGESAKTMNRKALARLLEYCRTHKGRVDAVLIYKIDRIARNMADHVAIRSLLSQYGVRIYSVTEPIGGDNSTSKLLENVMASFAQFDNDAKSERTKDGINKRVSKGEISWVAPVGYNNIMKPGGHKTIVPDPERAPMVKKLFEEYAKGIYKESEITRMANNLGFTT
ncbi:MAG: Site-specific recombinase, partial [Candidatus Gottesmanbacteria bacterium GW2011_GWA1_42_26]